jgi:zinc protease
MLLPAGGLGKISSPDLQASLRDTGWEFNTAIAPTAFVVSSSTVKTNLPIMLQVLAAFMSDPGFRPEIDERLPGAVEVMFRMLNASPQMALGDATLSAVDPDSPDRIPPRETVARWRSADFDRLLRPALTQAPVELTIVGDVDEATATQLVAATFGALPPRAAPDKARPDARFTHFPEREFPVIRTTHGGPADQAAASLIWPLYVAEPARRREEYALKLLAGVFNDDLRQRARVELGKTYAPEVATAMPDYAGQGILSVQIEGQPADIDLLVIESRALVQKLVGGAISQGDIDAVRTPLLAAAAAARSRNAWWAAALDGSARTVTVTEEATNYSALMSSITLDDVKAAAVKWLARPPIVTVATPRAAPPPAAAAKGKRVQ